MSSAGLKAGSLVVGIAAGGGVAWLLQPCPAAPPPRLAAFSSSVPTVTMLAASPHAQKQTRKEKREKQARKEYKEDWEKKEGWETVAPGMPLPYALSGIGPKPGPPTQQIAGIVVTGQATDADGTDRSGKALLSSMLTASLNSPSAKNILWEVIQTGFSAEGSPNTDESIAIDSLPPGETGQKVTFEQTFPSPRKHPKFLILRGLLRQVEDYEEPLTFQTPATKAGAGGKRQSQQTPSRVTVTLPPQGLLASGTKYGDRSMLLLSFHYQPVGPVELPQSPLFQKYHKPIFVRVGVMTPSGSSYEDPFSDLHESASMSLYKQPNKPWQYGSNPSVLTLVVQQRVYFHEIYFALRVPVMHKPFSTFER